MKKNKKRVVWIWKCIAFLSVLGTVAAVAIGCWIGQRFERQLPDDFFRLTVKGASPRFYAYNFKDRANRDGEIEEITTLVYTQKQTAYVPIQEIPDHVIHAFIAIEDKRFFQHSGVDWRRTLSAGVHYITRSAKHFGGSTITQQLVKNMTGDSEVTLSRKIQEILYAIDMERTLDKTQILELYLNVIHFSDQCDGISAASMHYFSKEPRDLTLTEAATIAAITNSPSYYNPIRNPQNNLARRNLILDEMLQQGYISNEEYASAVNEPIALHVYRDTGISQNVNSWYTDMVIEDVITDLMKQYHFNRSTASQILYSGGLRIETAMDREVQGIVEEYYKSTVQMPTNKDGTSAQSSIIVIDSKTGDILGVVGAVGKKSGNRLQNFATQTKRPPGSTIKPLSVYAPALEEGLINWASVFDDVPIRFDMSNTTAWPKNATGVYRGLTNVAYAVAHSTNTVAVKILEQIGVEKAFDYAKNRFHLHGLVSTPQANDCDIAALALGQLNYGVTLRDLTTAYTVFADGGMYHPWRSYYRVLDTDGNIVLSCPDRGDVAISEENAAIMTKLLQKVISEGTSSAITLGKLVECAGKTGTSNDDGDRWFIGYTPDVICGVWCGYEYPEPLQGRNICTSIWNKVMHRIVDEEGGTKAFSVPQSVIKLSYCKDSGLLTDEECEFDPRGKRVEEGWFVKGSEPQRHCDRHILCDYDVEHGGISHGNCPQEALKKVALLRVDRSFPIEILINDAQYVYWGDPMTYQPNPNPKQSYFAPYREKHCGISAVERQYNRSCTEHLIPQQPSNDWDYLIPKEIPAKAE